MREILFRGKGNKKYNDGDWYYGVPIQCDDGDWQICTNCSKRTVIAESIGQYTGLTDKNGKKVFEGDVIDTPDRLCEVYWFEKNAQFDLRFIRNAHNKRIINFKGIAMRDLSDYEIIGNIYDNPELLRSDTE